MTATEPLDAEPVLAAEYIRMSTEHQRYSPDNQRAAIREYAARRGFHVVESYQDAGKSGLTLKGRPALKQMLADVLSGGQPYKAILVLDISRWGRFQDTDQAAYYEFMCREAGVAVHYCNEPFDNEGGTMASIVKHMKRVMAAEYSRELSMRVSRAQRQQARLGFKQGGEPPLGVRRQVVDEHGNPRFLMERGQRKALSTDKVIYVRGPAPEVALLRRVYRLFVEDELRLVDIERWLNKRGKTQPNGSPWTISSVRHLLCNELYRGRYVFGRLYNNLGNRRPAKTEDWAIATVLEPLVSDQMFMGARARLEITTRRQLTDAQLIKGLARLLAETGELSRDVIRACPYLPFPETYTRRFGSLAKAFRLVGVEKPTRFLKNAAGIDYTDEGLLDHLRRIHKKRGYLTAKAIDADPAAPRAGYYIRRFGGLMNAYAMAGAVIDAPTQRLEAALQRQRAEHGVPLPRKNPRHRNADGTEISNEQLLQWLKEMLAEHGYLSMGLINRNPSIPAQTFFRKRFGGIRNAYALAGYVSTQSEIVRAACRRSATSLSPPVTVANTD
jgi:DNA invertase Pin-like site-specific DNA recombinase